MSELTMNDKMRIIQELVPGKQITLAHIIANPDPILYEKLGLDPRVDRVRTAIGILTVSPCETAVIAADIHNAVPVSFRATRFFKQDTKGDRWFTFADAGTGISIKKHPQEIVILKIGGGHRVSLSRDTKLDFNAALRCTYTHPDIYFEHEIISQRWINRNNAIVVSASVGMAVTF